MVYITAGYDYYKNDNYLQPKNLLKHNLSNMLEFIPQGYTYIPYKPFIPTLEIEKCVPSNATMIFKLDTYRKPWYKL